MHPILFEIFGFPIHSFGIMVAIGFTFGLLRMLKVCPKYKIQPDKVFDIVILSIIFGIIGSRLLYVLIKHSDYTFVTALRVWEGGLSFHGGLFLGILSIWIYSKINKICFLKILDLIAPSLCIAYTFGRIGCFLNGCCYGIATNFFWGVPMPTESGIILSEPTQIYSAIAGITIFFILRRLEYLNKKDGFIVINFLLMYGIYRFFIEFLRNHLPNDFIFGLITQGQIVSILMVLIACIILICSDKKNNNK